MFWFNMAYLVNDQTEENVELPEGESTVGRGPLLKVSFSDNLLLDS